MSKKVKVQSKVPDFTGLRNTDFGAVSFVKGMALCEENQARFLMQRGYFCEVLGAPVPPPEPDELEVLKAENIELKQAVQELKEIKQAQLDQLADLQGILKKDENKIAELEAKTAKAQK